MASLLAQLATALQDAGLDVKFRDLREIVWLAKVLLKRREDLAGEAPTSDVARLLATAAQTRGPAEERQPASNGQPVSWPHAATTPAPRPATTLEANTPRNSKALYGETANRSDETDGSPARRLRVRGVPALRDARLIGRALRPLSIRRAIGRFELDGRATAEFIAETGLRLPVMRRALTRVFEIVLVVEHVPSLAAWRPLVDELEQVLRRQGGLRAVTRMTLRDDGEKVEVTPGLFGNVRRRIILVVSDATSEAWRFGRVGIWLQGIQDQHPVALVQLLPQTLWPNTAAGFAELKLRALRPGEPNAELHQERPDWALEEPGVAVPVIALVPSAVANWARMITGAGDTWTPAALIPVTDEGPTEETYAQSAEQLVDNFLASATEEALQLAAYFSVVKPLTPPVMRVVQQAMARDSGSDALAQVLLGGLMRVADNAAGDFELAEFEFHAGVRSLLARGVTNREFVQARLAVWEYLQQRSGTTADFFAMLEDEEGLERLPPGARPFTDDEPEPMALSRGRQTSRRGALLIGVGKLAVLPHLSGVAQSAEAMRDWFLSQKGVGPDDVAMLTDDHEPVTSWAVHDRLQQLTNEATYRQLIIYFAGYAFGTPKGERWLLSGALENSNESIDPDTSAYGARYCGVPHVIFISDTCEVPLESFALLAMAGSSAFSAFPTSAVRRTYGTVDRFRAHSPADAIAEPNPRGVCVFTEALVDGLSGHHLEIVERLVDEPSTGRVTVRSLADFLIREMPRRLSPDRPSLQPEVTIDAGTPERWISELELRSDAAENILQMPAAGSVPRSAGAIASQGDEIAEGQAGSKKSAASRRADDSFPQVSFADELRGHGAEIMSISWSPEDRYIGTASVDTTVRIWSSDFATLLATLHGHKYGVNKAAWSPDGKRLATCSYDRTIRIWSVLDWSCTHTFHAHDDDVTDAAWSPDGLSLLSSAADGSVALWRTNDWTREALWTVSTSAVTRVAWLSSQGMFASCSTDGLVRLGNRAINAPGSHAVLGRRASASLNCIAVSPDFKLLAVAGRDGFLEIWDWASQLLIHATPRSEYWHRSVSFSADGRFLAANTWIDPDGPASARGGEGAVLIWRTDDWRQVVEFDEPTSYFWPCSISWAPDSARLATFGDRDRSVRLWNILDSKVFPEADAPSDSTRTDNTSATTVEDAIARLVRVLHAIAVQRTKVERHEESSHLTAEEPKLIIDWLDSVREVVLDLGISRDTAEKLLSDGVAGARELAQQLLELSLDADRCFENHLRVVAAYARSIVCQVIVHKDGILVVAASIHAPGAASGYSVASWDGLIGRCVREGSVIWSDDISLSHDYIPAEPLTRSELVIPVGDVRQSREIAAAINIEMPRLHALTPEQREWLIAFIAPLSSRVPAARPNTWLSFVEADSIAAERLMADLQRHGRRVQPLGSVASLNAGDAVLLLASESSTDPEKGYLALDTQGLSAYRSVVIFIEGGSMPASVKSGLTASVDLRQNYDEGLSRLARILDPNGSLARRESAPQATATETRLRSIVLRIGFATDRAEVQSKDGITRYGSARGQGLTFGVGDVNVPSLHRAGAIERPSLLRFQPSLDLEKHFALVKTEISSESQFLNVLLPGMRDGSTGTLIYIPGFNTDFAFGMYRTAQIGADLNLAAPPVLYSWPSAGKAGAYAADEAAAESSEPHLAEWLRRLSASLGSVVHVWADGLGAQLALRALASDTTRNVRFGHIIVTRPDVDLEFFDRVARLVAKRCERLTAYVTTKDAMLTVSRSRHGAPRAGATVRVIPGVDIIHVSGESLAQASSASNVSLMSDVHSLLRGVPPISRMGMRAVTTPDGQFWMLGEGPVPVFSRR